MLSFFYIVVFNGFVFCLQYVHRDFVQKIYTFVFFQERCLRMGRKRIDPEDKKVRLNVAIKQKYVDLVKKEENSSQFVEDAIVEHLKKNKKL